MDGVEYFARIVLLLLAIVLYQNFANGTLPDWWRAKFFNAANPDSPTAIAAGHVTHDPNSAGTTRNPIVNPRQPGPQ